jgi:iron complex outermembrane receptor protein
MWFGARSDSAAIVTARFRRQCACAARGEVFAHRNGWRGALRHIRRARDRARRPREYGAAPAYGRSQAGGQEKGREAEAKVEVSRGFSVLAAYTYLDSEITENEVDPAQVGLPLFLTPEHQFSIWGDYIFHSGPFDGLGLGAGVRYRGPAWGLNHEIETPDYALVDASVRYDLGKLGEAFDGYSVSVTARNLFDKEYIPACSFYEGCFYGDRRNVIGTIKYTW